MKSISNQVKLLEKRLGELVKVIGLEVKKEEAKKLEKQTMAADFWQDQEKAQKVMQKLSEVM